MLYTFDQSTDHLGKYLQCFPNLRWLSLQYENKLLLVDPGKNLSIAPILVRTIDIPSPGNGPHGVYEIGNRIWAGLKDASPETGKYYVFSSDISSPNASDPILYECLKSPVFIKEEPVTKLIYVSQDSNSSIMRIDPTSGNTTQLPIPSAIGNTPVGMITAHGPMSGVWFGLAGNVTGGSGSFGRIDSTGELQFFQLKDPQLGANAGILHIADASTMAGGPALWLLSTSLLSQNSPDALIRVTFDGAVTTVTGEEYISMPTQQSWAHRVVVLDKTVLVSQLHTFTLAQLVYNNTMAGQWLPAGVVSSTPPKINNTAS